MTIRFTDQELAWIDKKWMNWTIKDGCPKILRKNIEEKLKELSAFHRRMNEQR